MLNADSTTLDVAPSSTFDGNKNDEVMAVLVTVTKRLKEKIKQEKKKKKSYSLFARKKIAEQNVVEKGRMNKQSKREIIQFSGCK